jgi:predicted TIM-barrel fold metal-dependent hydrolase
MSYAGHRRIIDADSHVIELDDFLERAATPAERALIPPMDAQQELPVSAEAMARARDLFEKRQREPELMARFEESLLDTRKSGWSRLGAFDPAERSHTLDLFGFEMQLVLPTFSFHQVGHESDPAVARAGAASLNRGMGSFCAHDDRLRAIGYVPLRLGAKVAVELIDEGLRGGCYTFMVDTNEPDPKAPSFTHPDFDAVWRRFEEADVPFVIHIAVNGEYEAVPPSFGNNGAPKPIVGGDSPAGALGLIGLKNSAELFLSAMIFDGVFQRHPRLRCISMEHGAVWLPSWLQSIDMAVQTFGRLQPGLQDLELRPSEYVHRQMKFAPFAGEPLGWIIENVGTDLLVFGSDYPHPEGTHNPIERFEATMEGCDAATFDAFYHGNMLDVMGDGVGG